MKTSTSALLTMLKPLTVWITTNWKILKEIGIPDHLTCLLTGSKLGKEYIKAVHCHLVFMQSTSCEMSGWMKHKLESRLPGER